MGIMFRCHGAGATVQAPALGSWLQLFHGQLPVTAASSPPHPAGLPVRPSQDSAAPRHSRKAADHAPATGPAAAGAAEAGREADRASESGGSSEGSEGEGGGGGGAAAEEDQHSSVPSSAQGRVAGKEEVLVDSRRSRLLRKLTKYMHGPKLAHPLAVLGLRTFLVLGVMLVTHVGARMGLLGGKVAGWPRMCPSGCSKVPQGNA